MIFNYKDIEAEAEQLDDKLWKIMCDPDPMFSIRNVPMSPSLALFLRCYSIYWLAGRPDSSPFNSRFLAHVHAGSSPEFLQAYNELVASAKDHPQTIDMVGYLACGIGSTISGVTNKLHSTPNEKLDAALEDYWYSVQTWYWHSIPWGLYDAACRKEAEPVIEKYVLRIENDERRWNNLGNVMFMEILCDLFETSPEFSPSYIEHLNHFAKDYFELYESWSVLKPQEPDSPWLRFAGEWMKDKNQ